MNTPDRKSDLIHISKILPRVMDEIKRLAELQAVKDMQ